MKLYRSRPVQAEVTEHNIWGQIRYSVRRSDGSLHWMDAERLKREYEPLDGIGWASVTRREENA